MIKFRVYEHGSNYLLKQTIIRKRMTLCSTNVIIKTNVDGEKSFKRSGKPGEFMYISTAVEDAFIRNTDADGDYTGEELLLHFNSSDIDLGEVKTESEGMLCIFLLFNEIQMKKVFDEIYKRLMRKCVVVQEVNGRLKEVGEFWEER